MEGASHRRLFRRPKGLRFHRGPRFAQVALLRDESPALPKCVFARIRSAESAAAIEAAHPSPLHSGQDGRRLAPSFAFAGLPFGFP